jgi:hypothetical protein
MRPSYTAGGNVNGTAIEDNCLEWVLKNLNIELLYDPEIPLIDLEDLKTGIQTDPCTQMFIDVLHNNQKLRTCPKAHQKTTGRTKCSIHPQWNII